MRIVKIVEEIHRNCYLDKIIYYIKVHCIQAPLEAFIGLFLFVWGMIYSDPSLLRNDDIIKVPVGIATLTCLIYLIIINCKYICCVRKIIAKNLKNEELFNEAEDSFLKVSNFIHVFGILSYFFVTTVIIICFYGIKELFTVKNMVFLLIGSLIGTIWNWRGYSGDRRIDCRKIFKGIKNVDMDQIVWVKKSLSLYIKCLK